MDKLPPSPEVIESLMTWMRQRPRDYCRFAGELDSALWYLRLVWAKMANKDDDYRVAIGEIGIHPRGLLSDQQRKEIVEKDSLTTRQVQEFWERVDERLGIPERTGNWHTLG